MRGHKWVDDEGKQFQARKRDGWGHLIRGYESTWKPAYSKEKDRVCCNCEKVELHATKKTMAGDRMKNTRVCEEKKLMMELRGAANGAHPRVLSPEEQEIEATLRRAGIPNLERS